MVLAREKEGLTADEFMALNLQHAELINGEVRELMPPVWQHGEIAGLIYLALQQFVRQNRLGKVSVEPSFLLKAEPRIVRAPDVAFLSNADLIGKDTQKYIEGAPTLAVEVVSQHDSEEEIQEKADLFLEVGSQVVWIVYPRHRTVMVRTPDDSPIIYEMGQSIPGGDILPGFELPVAQIFED